MNLELALTPPGGDSQPTMSSLQIAAITGKSHRDVVRDILVVFRQAEIDARKFAHTYKDSQNRNQKHFILPRRECDLVVSGYSVKYRLAIIDRWHELESKQAFQLPTSFADALRLAADQQEAIETLRIEVAEAAPKVEFYDTVTESNTDCNIATAAKLAKLPYGQNTLFRKLREMGMLISGSARHNQPKQRYIEQGLFNVSQGFYIKDKEPVVTFTTLVTQKGLAWIIKNLGPKKP